MWYGSCMDIDFKAIRVPIHWAGRTRDGVWTCGSCRDVDACKAAGRCQDATDEAWERDHVLAENGFSRVSR